MVAFRNVLAHGYATLDHRRVYEIAARRASELLKTLEHIAIAAARGVSDNHDPEDGILYVFEYRAGYRKPKDKDSGKLRIGDDWTRFGLSHCHKNPLKAIAEFVRIALRCTRKTHHNHPWPGARCTFLSIKDDGDGVPRDADGLPDFKYVATHICDSIKRRLKADGSGAGLQGEFGIGLLSFWTVGDRLTMISTGTDQRAYQMAMSKGDSRYKVSPRRVLFAEKGTELKISPLLEGIRSLSGEKIQWYLASELRDRIRDAQVRVTVIDRLARKQYEVEPRQFEGRLLHQLPAIRTVYGDAYAELYLAEPDEAARVALTRAGTRVIEDMSTLSGLEDSPWSSRYLQGLIDVPFLNLTPGTRTGSFRMSATQRSSRH